MCSPSSRSVALILAGLLIAASGKAAPISLEESWWYKAPEMPEVWPGAMWVDDFDESGLPDALLQDGHDFYLLLDPGHPASVPLQHLPMEFLPSEGWTEIAWPIAGARVMLSHHSNELFTFEQSGSEVTVEPHFIGMAGQQLVRDEVGEPVLYGFGEHVVARLPFDRQLGRFGQPSVLLASASYTFSHRSVVLDLDQDGALEVVNAGDDEVVVLRPGAAIGAVELVEAHQLDDQASRPLRVDLDQDGRADLLSCSRAVTWLATPASGAELLHVQRLYQHDAPISCAIGDLDNDGGQDVVLVDALNVSWLQDPIGASPGGLHLIMELTGSSAAIAAGDLDADGDVDVVVSLWDSRNDLLLYENVNAASDTWAAHVLSSEFHNSGSREVVLEDFDQDGDPDIVRSLPGWSLDEIGLVEWYENLDGAGLFAEAVVAQQLFMVGGLGLEPGNVVSTDSVDLLTSAAISTLLSFGADGWQALDSFPAGDLRGACGYVDSSGAEDELVLWVPDPYRRRLVRLRAPASEPNRLLWSEPEVVSTRYSFSWLLCDDVDGDGEVDLVGTTVAPSNGSRSDFWQLAYGGGGALLQPPASIFEMRYGTGSLADLDQDGDKDLLAVGNDAIAWWQNPGRGSTELWRHHVVTGLPHADHTCADDFDLDGDVDVLVCGRTTCYYAEHLDGEGCFAPRVALFEDGSVNNVVCGDQDGDGKSDVVASVSRYSWPANIYDGVKLFRNLGAPRVDAGSQDALGHCSDAGLPDSGGLDVGSPDSAGLDASAVDQALVDAGNIDVAAAEPDAGARVDAAVGQDSGAADGSDPVAADSGGDNDDAEPEAGAEGCGCAVVVGSASSAWLLLTLLLGVLRRGKLSFTRRS